MTITLSVICLSLGIYQGVLGNFLLNTGNTGATNTPSPTPEPSATVMSESDQTATRLIEEAATQTAAAVAVRLTETSQALLVQPTPSETASATLTATPAAAAQTVIMPTSTREPPTPTASFQFDAPTSTPAAQVVPTGSFNLIKPVGDEVITGVVEFVWRWTGPVTDNQGFEVQVWQTGEQPLGAHDAIADNRAGQITSLGDNTYSLTLDIVDAVGVRGRSGDYNWTVVLIQIEPVYQDLGIQASPPGVLHLQ